MKTENKKEAADFLQFVGKIKEKTGLSVTVFSEDGAAVVGGREGETVKVRGGTYSEGGNTYFPLKYKSKTYTGRLLGLSGEEGRNYAYFINELAENFFYKVDLSVTEFYKAILFGELNYSQLQRYVSKFSVPACPCFVMLISVGKGKVSDILGVINGYGNDEYFSIVELDEYQCAFIKFFPEANGDYQSSSEYAEGIILSVYEELGIPVKICIGGTVKSVYDLSSSYQQALTAARMSSSIDAKGEVHSFKEYIMIKMLEDLPKYKLNEYLEILLDVNAREIFEDEEMINTAEEFLANSLNVSETSRRLYLHRNTLAYRLDKIEKATGLNIRKFSDAVTFRLITVLAKLVK